MRIEAAAGSARDVGANRLGILLGDERHDAKDDDTRDSQGNKSTHGMLILCSRSRLRDLAIVDEVGRAGFRQQRQRQPPWLIEIRRERKRVIDQIARLASTQLYLARPQLGFEERLDQRTLETESLIVAVVLENLDEFVGGRRLGKDLELDPPEKCLVNQFGGLEIRGEHDEHVKRQSKISARSGASENRPGFRAARSSD